MAFIPVQYDDGKLQYMECATTQTIVKGNAMHDNGSGYLALAAADDGLEVTHVAMQTVTTTANGERVLCLRVDGVQFEADCEEVVSLTDIGTYVDLASKATLDPDSGTDQLFWIERIVGGVGAADTSTKVIGQFTKGNAHAN